MYWCYSIAGVLLCCTDCWVHTGVCTWATVAPEVPQPDGGRVCCCSGCPRCSCCCRCSCYCCCRCRRRCATTGRCSGQHQCAKPRCQVPGLNYSSSNPGCPTNHMQWLLSSSSMRLMCLLAALVSKLRPQATAVAYPYQL